MTRSAPARDLLIGTYTTGTKAEGLYWATANDDGEVRIESCLALDDPSFVVLHPWLPLAYVVSELPDRDGNVSAIAIDRTRRTMSLRMTVPAGGRLPCHAAVAGDGGALWVACYGSGNASVLALDANGMFAAEPFVLQHSGRSRHPRRQASPHPHCVVPHPNGRDAYVTDLGIDRIERYRRDGRTVVRLAGTSIAAGAGPRHLCFAPDRKTAALTCELDNTVRVFAAAEDGALTERSAISALPAGFTGRSYASEIATHPSAPMLYAGNRGHDSIACIALAGDLPRLVAHAPTHGAHPRHFAVSPAGDRLIVGNRDSDNVASYRVDPQTGTLDMNPKISAVPAPACIRWL